MSKKNSFLSSSRKLINQYNRIAILQIIGACLLLGGIATLLFTAFYEQLIDEITGSIPAIGFLIIMLGIALLFPDMLRGSTKSISSMRVAVLMVVSVFVVMVIKAGWNSTSLKDIEIDNTWAYIIGIALGSKAAQTVVEKVYNPNRNTDNKIFDRTSNKRPDIQTKVTDRMPKEPPRNIMKKMNES